MDKLSAAREQIAAMPRDVGDLLTGFDAAARIARDEIARLQAELAEARQEAAELVGRIAKAL
jgi:hypothetical protein